MTKLMNFCARKTLLLKFVLIWSSKLSCVIWKKSFSCKEIPALQTRLSMFPSNVTDLSIKVWKEFASRTSKTRYLQ